jgi:hypothetical protein
MSFIKTSFVVIFAVFMVGCASITGSKNQPVNVTAVCDGKVVTGATCTLTNDKGMWYVSTPGTAYIQKSTSDMAVTCTKDEAKGTQTFSSSSNTGVWGNILLGGPIGLAVDAGTGAGFDYSNAFNVVMLGCPVAQETPKGKK